MKKYLVVAWQHYYPAPGLGNIKDSFDTLEEAEALFLELSSDDWMDEVRIIDRDSLTVLKNN